VKNEEEQPLFFVASDSNPASQYLNWMFGENGYFVRNPETAQTNTPLGFFTISRNTPGTAANWITQMVISAIAPGDILLQGEVFIRITTPGLITVATNFIIPRRSINFTVPAGLDISIFFNEIEKNQ